MTSKEKEDNPTHEIHHGYLRKYDYKEAFKKSWDEADKEDKDKIHSLPNFDAELFFEISGIDVRRPDSSDKIETLKKCHQKLIYKATKILTQIEALS